MSERDYDPLSNQPEVAAKQQADADKLEREQAISDFKYLMEQPQGRRFVWRLLERSGVFRSSFSLNGLDMAFKEGNRNYGVSLIADLNEHCPGRYLQMIKDSKAQHERSRKRQTN